MHTLLANEKERTRWQEVFKGVSAWVGLRYGDAIPIRKKRRGPIMNTRAHDAMSQLRVNIGEVARFAGAHDSSLRECCTSSGRVRLSKGWQRLLATLERRPGRPGYRLRRTR